MPFVAKIAKALADKSPNVRKAAADALGTLGQRHSEQVAPYAPELAKLLSDQKHTRCVEAAVYALKELGEHGARYSHVVAKLLDSPDD